MRNQKRKIIAIEGMEETAGLFGVDGPSRDGGMVQQVGSEGGAGGGVPWFLRWIGRRCVPEELLGVLANPVGSDIPGEIRSYPLKTRDLRIGGEFRDVLVADGCFAGSGRVVSCSVNKL
jgi:hypothetical protein